VDVEFGASERRRTSGSGAHLSGAAFCRLKVALPAVSAQLAAKAPAWKNTLSWHAWTWSHRSCGAAGSSQAAARLASGVTCGPRAEVHRFNQIGLAALDPRWAEGRPRRISTEDEEFILATAATRPRKLGRPFTRWSLRKLAGSLARNPDRMVRIGRERLRQILREHRISFQRTRTARGDRPVRGPAALQRGPAPDLLVPS
jgi:transposase